MPPDPDETKATPDNLPEEDGADVPDVPNDPVEDDAGTEPEAPTEENQP